MSSTESKVHSWPGNGVLLNRIAKPLVVPFILAAFLSVSSARTNADFTRESGSNVLLDGVKETATLVDISRGGSFFFPEKRTESIEYDFFGGYVLRTSAHEVRAFGFKGLGSTESHVNESKMSSEDVREFQGLAGFYRSGDAHKRGFPEEGKRYEDTPDTLFVIEMIFKRHNRGQMTFDGDAQGKQECIKPLEEEDRALAPAPEIDEGWKPPQSRQIPISGDGTRKVFGKSRAPAPSI